jgi:hypothetical protein
MSHYESARLCQNDVVASHYESRALVVPAGGPMLLAGLTDTLQGVAVRRWQLINHELRPCIWTQWDGSGALTLTKWLS